MSYLSVCSGIEAATVAWHPLGWRAWAYSEIGAFPSAVLAHYYQDTPNFGDMTRFQEWPDATVDVLIGGTPCQSFSVAGLRRGLDDPRGNLMLTYLAIAGRYRPRWLVWENVPGVLSSDKGRAFGTFLGGLGELGYGFAYRILDAQYCGVPQRRRRVFVVGCLGNWRRAAAVLFERASLCGNPPPSRKAGQNVAGSITRRIDRGGVNSEGGDGHLIAHALRADGFDASEDGTGRGTPLISVPERARALTSSNQRIDAETETLLTIAFDTTQITSVANYSNPQAGDPCHPLAAGAHAPAIAFNARQDPDSGPVTHPLDTDGSSIGIGMRVRRLTPRECERLQGFPDDYTLIAHRSKPAKDGPRYKALGNSMAVPVMRWIGERIAMVDAITHDIAEAA